MIMLVKNYTLANFLASEKELIKESGCVFGYVIATGTLDNVCF